MANKEMILGKWKEIKGEAQRQWGKLTGDELDQAEGDMTKLSGLIQQKYGKSKEEADKELNEWMEKQTAKS